jgi:hypothetical protein
VAIPPPKILILQNYEIDLKPRSMVDNVKHALTLEFLFCRGLRIVKVCLEQAPEEGNRSAESTMTGSISRVIRGVA